MTKHVDSLHLPEIALLFLCLLLSMGQLEKFSLFGHGVYLHDFLISAWLVVSVVRYTRFRAFLWKHVSQMSLLAKLLTGWTIGTVILMIALFPVGVQEALLYSARFSMYVSFGWLIAWNLQEKRIRPTIVSTGVLLLTTLLAWFGILQYVLLPDMRVLAFLGWDDHYYRLISTLLDPAFTGLMLIFGWLLWRQEVDGASLGRKWLAVGACFLILSALLLTYSRASYLAFGLCCISAIVHRLWTRQFLRSLRWGILLGVFGAALLMLPRPGGEGVKLERTSTIVARQENILSAISGLSVHELVLGKGPFLPVQEYATSEFPDHSTIPDNWVVFAVQSSGLVGALLVIAWLIQTLWRLSQISETGSLLLAATLVHGMFSASLVYPWVVIVLGLYLTPLLIERNR